MMLMLMMTLLRSGFAQVMENPESHAIEEFHFPGWNLFVGP